MSPRSPLRQRRVPPRRRRRRPPPRPARRHRHGRHRAHRRFVPPTCLHHTHPLTPPDIHGVQTSLGPTTATATPTPPPAQLALPPDTTAVAAGATHFAALTAGGSVLTWGDARHPLPLGRDGASDVPGVVGDLEELPGGERVVKVAAGGYATAALTGGGDAYVWGAGWAGGTGSGEGEEGGGRPEPLEMEVRDLAVGGGWGVVVDEGGVVWVRGEGGSGELGLGEGVVAVEEWREVSVRVEEGWVVRRLWAGPGTGFLVVEEEGGGGGPAGQM